MCQTDANHIVLPAAGAVLRMFNTMSKIFLDTCKEDTIYCGIQIERKRRWKRRDLKWAVGIEIAGEDELRIRKRRGGTAL